MTIKRITFNKASVILMYICVIGLFAFCFITREYPPTAFTISWLIFWCCQAVITCRLQIDKRAKKENEKHRVEFLSAITPYLNEENASALIEKYIGIEPKYDKEPKRKKAEKKTDKK